MKPRICISTNNGAGFKVRGLVNTPARDLALLWLDLHHSTGDHVLTQHELGVPLQRALVALQVILRQRCQRGLHRLNDVRKDTQSAVDPTNQLGGLRFIKRITATTRLLGQIRRLAVLSATVPSESGLRCIGTGEQNSY